MHPHTARLLYVEDNFVDVMWVKSQLEEAKSTKFEVAYAESLHDAEEILGEQIFHLILLDLGLPDSQGIETFFKMRDYSANLPIVVVSGLDDEVVAIEAVANGAQDYLCKDRWDSQTVIRSLNYAIERHKILNQRRQAEEAARQSESRFRAVFEGSEDWIFINDRHLKFVQVNPAMARALSMDVSELVGRRSGEVFGAEAGKNLEEIYCRALEGQTVEAEYNLPIGGIPYIWSYSVSPLRDADGNVTGIFGIARDVTDRKHRYYDAVEFADEYPSKAIRSTLSMVRRTAPLKFYGAPSR
jgi:hypothetical protein